MDAIGPFIIFGAIAFVFILLAQQSNKKTNDAFTQLAKKYGGRATSSFLSRPDARFVFRGAQVLVDIYATGGKHKTYYTQVHIFDSFPGVRIEVYPEGIWSSFGKLLGMNDIEIGSPAFDSQYVIKANNVATVRRTLSLPAQRTIQSLRTFLRNDDIYVSVNTNALLVKKRSRIRNFPDLDRLCQLSFRLYEDLKDLGSEGIDFMGHQQPEMALEESICQVCGEEIRSHAVLCKSCHTPHHRDCWEYYGACSTYGCRQNRYVFPDARKGRHRKSLKKSTV